MSRAKNGWMVMLCLGVLGCGDEAPSSTMPPLPLPAVEADEELAPTGAAPDLGAAVERALAQQEAVAERTAEAIEAQAEAVEDAVQQGDVEGAIQAATATNEVAIQAAHDNNAAAIEATRAALEEQRRALGPLGGAVLGNAQRQQQEMLNEMQRANREMTQEMQQANEEMNRALRGGP